MASPKSRPSISSWPTRPIAPPSLLSNYHCEKNYQSWIEIALGIISTAYSSDSEVDAPMASNINLL